MTQGIESRLATHEGLTVTVDTAILDVGLVLTGNPHLTVNGSIKNLPNGEGCIIKGFALCFPYQFGQGSIPDSMFVQLGWEDDNGHNDSVDAVGDTGRINIPDCNYWYDSDIYVPVPSAVDSKWHFRILGLGGNVSMLNVPAALDDDVLETCFHLKIQHTTQLIG